jgi:hypothetical protein
MAIQQVEMTTPPRVLPTEPAEVKQPMQYHDVDDSLSEWELARLTSKTWSMEQD